MGMRDFMNRHFHHFNAREVRQAAEGWVELLDRGGKMMVTLGGAMSTAELGISLAELIRRDKVHAITCTGANLEEDVFNLVAHDDYHVIPKYRELSAADEQALLEKGLNRVTDTCIPETVMRHIEGRLLEEWQKASEAGARKTPWEFMAAVASNSEVARHYQVPPENSWVLAARRKEIPVYVPGWEDSTLGNMFTALVMRGKAKHEVVKTGTEQMQALAEWYQEQTGASGRVGFFQIGGGISGDFPICVVPMLHQDLKRTDVPMWAYFCQITDSVTSYGSYSGAIPNEKITWGKLAVDTPRFMINSDATIVAPLVFAYVLDE